LIWIAWPGGMQWGSTVSWRVYDDEVRADVGAVTAQTMRRVEAGLRAALDLTD
jgi:hypothetical protein